MSRSDPADEESERRFWRSLRPRVRTSAPARPSEAIPEPPGVTADGEPAGSDPARIRGDEPRTEARRLALRHLLQAAEARVDRASRTRRPALASGAVVRAVRGEAVGRTGIVLDADYIQSRVLLDFGPDEPHRWIPFAHVGPAESEG